MVDGSGRISYLTRVRKIAPTEGHSMHEDWNFSIDEWNSDTLDLKC